MKINDKPATVGELVDSMIAIIDRQTATIHKAHGFASDALKPSFGRLIDDCLDSRRILTKIRAAIQ